MPLCKISETQKNSTRILHIIKKNPKESLKIPRIPYCVDQQMTITNRLIKTNVKIEINERERERERVIEREGGMFRMVVVVT